MKQSDKPKLIIASIVFLVAIALIAYNLKLFGGGGSSSSGTVEVKEGSRGGPMAAPTGK